MIAQTHVDRTRRRGEDLAPRRVERAVGDAPSAIVSASDGSGRIPTRPDLGSSRQAVCIELSDAQVDQVLHAARGGESLAAMLAGFGELEEGITHESLARQLSRAHGGKLSASLLTGLMVFARLPADGAFIGNRDLSKALGMQMSTAHRYLSTLVAAGLAERDPTARKYRRAL